METLSRDREGVQDHRLKERKGSMIAISIIFLIVGFAALTKGADIFVDGSAAIARRFHVPGMIIGLTIVALGTSAPELAVSTSSAIQGANELALSNVVGSNIFNLLCITISTALIRIYRYFFIFLSF